jgi:hypothetical protein
MANTHPYLKNKTINIVPTPAGMRWNNMVRKGTEAEMREAGFLYPGAMKGYAIQLTTNGIPQLLDDIAKKPCPDLIDSSGKPKELTEKEYFETKLGLNLDTFNPESDWFIVKRPDHTFKPTYVNIPNGELELNLSNPAHMLIYKVACSRPDKIAPSKEMYNQERRETQIFMMVEDKSNNAEVVDSIMETAKASEAFLKAAGNRKEMMKYFAVKGVMLSDNMSDEEIKKRFALDYDRDPVEFLKFAQDPDADVKYVILKARMLGLISQVILKLISILLLHLVVNYKI